MRASAPSLITSSALVRNSSGICALYVSIWSYAIQISACKSAGFFSSITTSGKPFTNSTISGLRVWCWPFTLNWFTAQNWLLATLPQSTSLAKSPRVSPSTW